MLDNIVWKPLMDILYPYPEYQVPPNVPGYNPWERKREHRKKVIKEAESLAKIIAKKNKQEEADRVAAIKAEIKRQQLADKKAKDAAKLQAKLQKQIEKRQQAAAKAAERQRIQELRDARRGTSGTREGKDSE